VVARDVVERMAQYPHASEFDLLALARELPTCREQMPAVEALRRLQKSRAPLAVVIDEHGSVAGLLTVEDLAEEILGPILDEDEEESPALRRESDHALLVRGDMPLQDLGRALDLDLEPRPGATTVAGLVIQTAGRIPKVGERMEIFPKLEAEIVEATVRQVRSVRLHLAAPEEEQGESRPA
jgi:putative hemolysin